MKDKKNMAMIIVVGIIISMFLFVNSTVFATTGTVLTSDLRLRKEGNASSEIMELLDENDQVEILGEDGDWYKVKAKGKVGFVSKQYIKVKEETNVLNNETTQNQENATEQANQTAENAQSQENAAEQTNQTTQNQENETNVEQNNVEQPKKAKFATATELKVMPLINGSVINSAQDSEIYDVICTAGLWSFVKSETKSGWVLTEKLATVDTEKKEETKSSEETSSEQKEETENKEESEKKEESSTEKLYSSAKTYYVKGTAVNARSSANKSSEVVKVLNTNNTVKVTGEDGDWYIVNINGDKAYIAKSLLSKEKIEVTSRSSNSLEEQNKEEKSEEEPSSVASNPSGSAIVAYAKQFLGYRYVYGTNGPNTFDCSGFVQYVYKHFGYSLSRSSGTQANDGVAVSKSNLEPGDVLIFRDTSNSRIGHVGLYIGGGQFIHASNSRTGVIISDLSTSAYQKRYVGARRIL